MLDYHVHLWPHPEKADPAELGLERIAEYCATAARAGVEEIALTEHLFRFRAGRAAVGDFYREEPDPELRSSMSAYFDHHATADLDEYVESVLAAKRAGLPVVLGLEVDYYAGRMDAVSRLLSGYPFDVLLGSVHWIGTWMFDVLGDEVAERQWRVRGVEQAWRGYTDALEELAGTRACDVLAHPDVVKVTGRRPPESLLEECHERMARAAAGSGMAAEVSSAGWRKPAAEQYPARRLLERFRAAGVPVTTASDSHGAADVGHASADLANVVTSAGYTSVRAFRARRPHDVRVLVGSGPGRDGAPDGREGT
ncbi:MAG: histidinol-phosphatase [Actinomycetota bacterium]|nr:histidinol-phosphatase [Actinomycetota bacterium]